MIKLLKIDFESQDRYISRKLGAGWVFGYNVSGSDFEILGVSIKIDDEKSYYTSDWNHLLDLVEQSLTLLAHNATYELGCLKVLEKQLNRDVGLKNKKIYDTKLLFKLYDSNLKFSSLDALSKKYLHKDKGYNILTDLVWNNDLYPWKKSELNNKIKAEKQGFVYHRERPTEKKLQDFAYKNMKLLHEIDYKAVGDYAILDIELCSELYDFVIKEIPEHLQQDYSDLVHIAVDYRLRGINVDLNKTKELQAQLEIEIEQDYKALFEVTQEEFNIRSSKDMPRLCDKLGLRYPLNESGNPTITKTWLKEQDHDFCKLVVKLRANLKLKNDFLAKIIEMQEFTGGLGRDIGKIYPELTILGADTGRFSSNSPNFQQQPQFVREIFVPDEGETFYSLDFSNQEGRLQIHYAKLLGCEDIDEFVVNFNKDPEFDMHLKIAQLIFNDETLHKKSPERKVAKTINLGLSYGMGLAKLGSQLKLTKQQAELLKEKYDLYVPFLSELIKKCTKSLKDNAYIKTINGRKIKADKPVFIDGERKTFEYKALNKLIQGSASDQITKCMIQAYKQGLKVLFPVHDELLLSGTEEDAKKLKSIMENTTQLVIPCFTDITYGQNWAACKEEK